jgi:ribosome assembly protein YihI (activator of Der GTPase)
LAEAILASAKHKSVDPRTGSKKPIDLSKYAKEQSTDSAEHGKISAVETIKYKTPQAEFDAIEADEKLEALLEKREEGKLSAAENAYVNKMTARYKVLCELMGIDVDDYANDNQGETKLDDDPFAALDAIKMDDYKD